MVLQSGSLPAGGNSPAFLELPVNNDRESIIRNITHNVGLGLAELSQHAWRERPLLVVAGGPSLPDYIGVIRAFLPDCDVLSINGAYRYLREQGIESDHFVMIDSRASNVAHVAGASYRTNHCLASQVHPSVMDELADKRVTMFHLGTQTARDALVGDFKFITAPIGMASIHAVYVAAALGYRTQMLFGYDFSGKHAFPQPQNDEDRHLSIKLNGKTFLTTLAMARTAEQFAKALGPVLRTCDLDVRLYSDGLLSEMIKVATSDVPAEIKERDKYENIWTFGDYRTVSPGLRYVDEAIDHMAPEPGSSIADFGCGTGRCTKWFADRGYMAVGVDIASNCLEEDVPFVQSPLWDAEKLPNVDYGFTTDVMEHIPTDKVEDTLRAIHGACAKGCYLNIDTIPDSFGVFIGQTLHMTVRPAEWWTEKLRAIWPYVKRVRLEDPQQAVFVCRRDYAES